MAQQPRRGGSAPPVIVPIEPEACGEVEIGPFTIVNDGGASAPDFRVGYYLSEDCQITDSDILLAYEWVSGGLASGASAVRPGTTVLLPADTEDGPQFIGIHADYSELVTEPHEDNNDVSAPVTVATLTDPVDLIFSSEPVVDPTEIPQGETIFLDDVVITNQGGRDASEFIVGYYLSTDDSIEYFDALLGRDTLSGLLLGMSDTLVDRSWMIPQGTSTGPYYIGIIADAYPYRICESDEGNNTAATPITVIDPWMESFAFFSPANTGCGWADYDGDGDDDLYQATTTGPDMLYRNDGMGIFVIPGAETGFDNSRHVAWGDYDEDGDLDYYLSVDTDANLLFRNDGGSLFFPVAGDLFDGRAAAWGDYDNDGDLDLYTVNSGESNYLLRNDGAGQFSDVTSSPLNNTGDGMDAGWADYDNDGDLDLYLVNSGDVNYLFRNEGFGLFADVTGWELSDDGDGRDVAWGDYNNDGYLDLFLVNYGPSLRCRLWRNESGAGWHEIEDIDFDARYTTAAGWGDYDNDGDLDLYLARERVYPEPNILLRNDGGTFSNVTPFVLEQTVPSVATAWVDYDTDGDLDVYVANTSPDPSTLIQNDFGNWSHWLQVDLEGNPSNSFGIGARIEVYTGDGLHVREVHAASGQSTTAHFGLGASDLVDSVVVRWPSGTMQSLAAAPADQRILIVEANLVGIADDAEAVPSNYQLHANIPNPFNPTTTIRFDLPGPGRVQLTIHDVTGRLVTTLANEQFTAGSFRETWNGTDDQGRAAASGIYFARLEAGEYTAVRKMVMLR